MKYYEHNTLFIIQKESITIKSINYFYFDTKCIRVELEAILLQRSFCSKILSGGCRAQRQVQMSLSGYQCHLFEPSFLFSSNLVDARLVV